MVGETVDRRIGEVLGLGPADEVEPDRSLRDLGFDSLLAVELRNRLALDTGLRLPATLVFDHPTPRQLGRHLAERMSGVAPASDPMTELDRLEGTLLALPAGDLGRDRAVTRLNALLAKLADEEPVADADELFALIDQELGGV
jgi:acyl carrier protein